MQYKNCDIRLDYLVTRSLCLDTTLNQRSYAIWHQPSFTTLSITVYEPKESVSASQFHSLFCKSTMHIT